MKTIPASPISLTVRVAGALLLLWSTSGWVRAATFQGLGFLPSANTSWASGVSGDGSVVVGYSQPAPVNLQAFRWTQAGGMMGLGVLANGYFTLATGVSDDGAAVVGYGGTASGYRAFRWTSGAGLANLGVLPSATYSYGWGTSGNGSVVVGWSGVSVTSEEAFRWTAGGGMVGLGKLPGAASSWAADVSADGSVVMGFSGGQVFRWTSSGGMNGIGGNQPGALSADGSTVVGTGDSQAFRWTGGGGLVHLGYLPGFDSLSWATGVSGDGSVVVGFCQSEALTRQAFIWDATHGMRSLQAVLENDHGFSLTGWNLTDGAGISADGRAVVGFGTDPNGHTQAWLAVIPEPSVGGLIALGGLFLSRRKQMSRLFPSP